METTLAPIMPAIGIELASLNRSRQRQDDYANLHMLCRFGLSAISSLNSIGLVHHIPISIRRFEADQKSRSQKSGDRSCFFHKVSENFTLSRLLLKAGHFQCVIGF